jgi:FtsP/CotA-like multicopper oxidase with cupredoxin domain
MKTRRNFLTDVAAASGLVLGACGRTAPPKEGIEQAPAPEGPADVTLRIGPVLADIAKEHTISTIAYNGTVPGPIVRLREGVPVTVDLFNDTDTPEFVHWHGQIVPALVDGASEEKSLNVPAHGHLRYLFTPQPAGARFVHSHVMAMSDTNRGPYTGQFAFVYIEPKDNPGRYDQEIFLATHEFEPFFGAEEMEEEGDAEFERKKKESQQKQAKPNGWEIGYQRFTINGKSLGYGDPIRVKEGQRVLFHILNASATENIQLALPGHQFQVIALDGNPVPQQQPVDVLELGTAERISAIVEMKNPGVWILGTPMDDDRKTAWGSSSNTRARPARRAGSSRRKRHGTIPNSARPAPFLHPMKPSPWCSAKSTGEPAASIAGPSTARPSMKRPIRACCTKAAATGWCSTTRPTTPIPSTSTATASS